MLGTYLLKHMQVISFLNQPPLTDCDRMWKNYDYDQMFTLAFMEHNSLAINKGMDNLNLNNVVSRNGALFCFCEAEVKEAKEDGGDGRFTTYTLEYTML